MWRPLHVDDISRPHALGRLMADADHAQALAVDPRHEADDLAGADIESRNHAVSCLSHDLPRRYAYTLRFTEHHTGPGVVSPGPRFLR